MAVMGAKVGISSSIEKSESAEARTDLFITCRHRRPRTLTAIIQGLYADQWGRVIHVGATHNEIVNHPTQIPGTDPSAWDPTLTGVAGGFEAYISRVYFNGTFPLAFPTSGPP